MPDKRRHRGAAPGDEDTFGDAVVPILTEAVSHLGWLLTRGYADKSALKLVGDRFQFTARQRTALMRASCSDQALAHRLRIEHKAEEVNGTHLHLDGYNVLCTVEAALARGVLLLGRDGCLRDMASMHGSYRKVAETIPAIKLIGAQIESLHIPSCTWLLDKPVSNSGRLKKILQMLAEEHGWDWNVELEMNPDAVLIESGAMVCSADSVVLDGCERWFNLARTVVESAVPNAWVVDLSSGDCDAAAQSTDR